MAREEASGSQASARYEATGEVGAEPAAGDRRAHGAGGGGDARARRGGTSDALTPRSPLTHGCFAFTLRKQVRCFL